MGSGGVAPQILTPRNVVTFFMTTFLLVGIVIGDTRMLLLGVGLFVMLVLAVVDAWPLLKTVEVKREHPTRVFQNSVLPVELEIRSVKGRTPELILVEDMIPASTHFRQRRLLPLTPQQNQYIQLQFFPPCDHRRGFYVLGPIRVEATDGLGFFRRIEVIEEMTDLLVYPDAVGLEQFPVLGEGTLEHVGLEVVPRKGVSEELLGTRDYTVGDSPRRIHWKLSARHDRLMVKEFEEELTTLVSIFLDLGRLGLAGVGDHTSVEYGVRIAASTARRATDLGHRFQFFGVSSKVDHFPAGGGVDHLLALLDRLAFVRAEGDSAFPIVVRDLTSTLPRGSTLIMIFGYTTAKIEVLLENVAACRSWSILPIIIMIDDRSFIKLYREQEEMHAKAESPEEFLRLLKLQGASAYLVTRGNDIPAAVMAGLQPSEEGARR